MDKSIRVFKWYIFFKKTTLHYSSFLIYAFILHGVSKIVAASKKSVKASLDRKFSMQIITYMKLMFVIKIELVKFHLPNSNKFTFFKAAAGSFIKSDAKIIPLWKHQLRRHFVYDNSSFNKVYLYSWKIYLLSF